MKVHECIFIELIMEPRDEACVIAAKLSPLGSQKARLKLVFSVRRNALVRHVRSTHVALRDVLVGGRTANLVHFTRGFLA